ncbi:MAG: hypothetical protein LH618_11165 [Saprospiraceae bacterium]|nr:hypothetical protein [Saprospiraceae bacterium]
MKNNTTLRLSFWAKSHRPAAIAIIVFSKITIGIIGLGLGAWAAIEGLILPLETKWLLAAVAASSIMAYPTKSLKKRLGRVIFYRRQKTMDGVVAMFGLAFWLFVGNLTPAWVANSNLVATNPTSVPVALSCAERPLPEARREIAHSGKLQRWMEKKAKAKIERAITKMKGSAEGGDAAGKILLTVVLFLIATALWLLVLYLSCNLSCSGQETAATLVILFGGGAITIGAIYAIKAVWESNGSSDLDDRHRKK